MRAHTHSLLFHKSHFSVLATVERPPPRGSAARHTLPTRLPLAVSVDGRATPLPVRFLLPEEEDRQADLLRKWMDIVPEGGTPGLPPGVTAFSLPRTGASADAMLRAVAATVQGGKSARGGEGDGR